MIKWILKLRVKHILNNRRKAAIKKAKAFHKKQPLVKYFVCQNGHEFFIGTKAQMRATENAIRRFGVNWHWRNNIEYETATN